MPYRSTAQMIEVDRAMIEDYHIALIQMMENANWDTDRMRCSYSLSGALHAGMKRSHAMSA